MESTSKVLLVILDGWGINPKPEYNAIALAQGAFWKHLCDDYPNSKLECAGKAVGLPAGQFGNSEVGHLNLGAGRVVHQDIARIDNEIESGAFFENRALLKAVEITKAGRKVHLMGLVSDGGVHSSDRHYLALLELFKKHGVNGDDVCFHAITDGRDTSPQGGIDYVAKLQDHMESTGVGRIARRE